MEALFSKLEENEDVEAFFIAEADGTVKLQSSRILIYPQEITALVKGFQDSRVMRTCGFTLCGRKYVCLHCDTNRIHGKLNRDGVTVAVSSDRKYVVAGFYNRNQVPGNCKAVVEMVAESL